MKSFWFGKTPTNRCNPIEDINIDLVQETSRTSLSHDTPITFEATEIINKFPLQLSHPPQYHLAEPLTS